MYYKVKALKQPTVTS